MKAVALLSGGLDSTLAAKLIQEQGIEVVALHFTSPFCLCNKRSSCKVRLGFGFRNEAESAAKNLGVSLKILNKGEELLQVIKNPKYGYGANMNPCIDCRILMFKKARAYMEEIGASFIITGEVVGQRPMSQRKNIMGLIEKEAGVAGLVLRPLSAQVMPETIPEKNGWVDRSKLLAITGRTRKPQIALAQKYNIKDYPCASGGCLLTDPRFSLRLKDLLKYGELNLNEIELLKIGRHFRLSPHTKLVVGRDKEENERILRLKQANDGLLIPQDTLGPTGLLRQKTDDDQDDQIDLSSRIVARYCDRNGKTKVKLLFSRLNVSMEKEVDPLSDETLKRLRI
ncbi:MAG: 7-cyano-7-deazaguanine synthase [Candidatus Omnitrophica bacterium]|nr:7-cyano-7-deazaguanine synthase [Candidatus Omnitrophota bacterium]